MASFNLIVDIPSCLLFEIWSKWLGGVDDYRRRSTMSLDSALCNKQARLTLLDLYAQVDWEKFLVLRDYSCTTAVERRMKRSVGRIKMSSLELARFPNNPIIMKAFFRWNAHSLKVLKLANSSGAMTALTKSIATECKALTTLCLERCNLTMPIATILNKTETISEVWLKSTSIARRSVPISLLERVCCPTVTNLALLDNIPEGCANTILTAFPNVVEAELMNHLVCSVLQTLMKHWQCRTLHLGYCDEAHAQALVARCREFLTKLIMTLTPMEALSMPALQRMLYACPQLTSPTLFLVWRVCSDDMLTPIADECSTRLQELRISDCRVTSATITALATRCPNLRVLSFGVSRLWRKCGETLSLTEILIQCRELERLRVRCLTLPEAHDVIINIAAHCMALQVLSFGDLIDLVETVHGIDNHSIATRMDSKVSLQALSGCHVLRAVEVALGYRHYYEYTHLENIDVKEVSYFNSVERECNF